MRSRLHLLPCILLVLLFSPPALAAVTAQPLPDLTGVYVLDAPSGTVVLEFREGRFLQHTSDGGTWAGVLSQQPGELTLTFEHHTVRTTCAVVDGVLWLAVLQPNPNGGPWEATALRHQAMSPGPFLKGPARVRRGQAPGQWLTQEAPDAPWQLASSQPAEVTQDPTPAVVTPWSVRLGQTGLRPYRGLPLWGRFEGGGVTVQFTGRAVPRKPQRFPGVRPEPTVMSTPAAPGVWMTSWGRGCGMGHMDAPAVTTYVVLDDRRVLRHVRPSAHWTPAPPLPDVVLTRVAAEAAATGP